MLKKVHSQNVLKECNVSTSNTLCYLICTVNCPQRWLFLKREYWNHSVKQRMGTFVQRVSTDINGYQILIFPHWPNKAADCYRLYQLSRKEEGPAKDIIVSPNCWHFSDILDHKQVHQSLSSDFKFYFHETNCLSVCHTSVFHHMILEIDCATKIG